MWKSRWKESQRDSLSVTEKIEKLFVMIENYPVIDYHKYFREKMKQNKHKPNQKKTSKWTKKTKQTPLNKKLRNKQKKPLKQKTPSTCTINANNFGIIPYIFIII